MSDCVRVLVTGVAGFIGAHVAESCLKLGFEVVGVDDLSGGSLGNVPEGVRFVEGDLRDEALVASLWDEGDFDFVYHLAAYAAEGLSHFIRGYNYKTNLLASINLLNESVNHGVKCLVFTSSIAVYGAGQLPMTEELVPQPEDPYGISKYAFELDLRAAKEMFGLNSIVFRPHNVYGEKQNLADKYRNVIGIFMNQIMKGEELTIFGDGSQTRAFSHIDDVAPVIARSVLNEAAYGEVFNVGADVPVSVLELAETVCAAFGVEKRIRLLEARNEVVHAYASHEKLRRFFDLPEPVSLADGIAQMAEWAKGKTGATPGEFGRIEIEKNMPPSWRSVFRG